jgi:hypothetical protein
MYAEGVLTISQALIDTRKHELLMWQPARRGNGGREGHAPFFER